MAAIPRKHEQPSGLLSRTLSASGKHEFRPTKRAVRTSTDEQQLLLDVEQTSSVDNESSGAIRDFRIYRNANASEIEQYLKAQGRLSDPLSVDSECWRRLYGSPKAAEQELAHQSGEAEITTNTNHKQRDNITTSNGAPQFSVRSPTTPQSTGISRATDPRRRSSGQALPSPVLLHPPPPPSPPPPRASPIAGEASKSTQRHAQVATAPVDDTSTPHSGAVTMVDMANMMQANVGPWISAVAEEIIQERIPLIVREQFQANLLKEAHDQAVLEARREARLEVILTERVERRLQEPFDRMRQQMLQLEETNERLLQINETMRESMEAMAERMDEMGNHINRNVGRQVEKRLRDYGFDDPSEFSEQPLLKRVKTSSSSSPAERQDTVISDQPLQRSESRASPEIPLTTQRSAQNLTVTNKDRACPAPDHATSNTTVDLVRSNYREPVSQIQEVGTGQSRDSSRSSSVSTPLFVPTDCQISFLIKHAVAQAQPENMVVDQVTRSHPPQATLEQDAAVQGSAVPLSPADTSQGMSTTSDWARTMSFALRSKSLSVEASLSQKEQLECGELSSVQEKPEIDTTVPQSDPKLDGRQSRNIAKAPTAVPPGGPGISRDANRDLATLHPATRTSLRSATDHDVPMERDIVKTYRGKSDCYRPEPRLDAERSRVAASPETKAPIAKSLARVPTHPQAQIRSTNVPRYKLDDLVKTFRCVEQYDPSWQSRDFPQLFSAKAPSRKPNAKRVLKFVVFPYADDIDPHSKLKTFLVQQNLDVLPDHDGQLRTVLAAFTRAHNSASKAKIVFDPHHHQRSMEDFQLPDITFNTTRARFIGCDERRIAVFKHTSKFDARFDKKSEIQLAYMGAFDVTSMSILSRCSIALANALKSQGLVQEIDYNTEDSRMSFHDLQLKWMESEWAVVRISRDDKLTDLLPRSLVAVRA